FSTYSYVNGSPLTGSDPYGLWNTSALPPNPSAYIIPINPADMPLVPQPVVNGVVGFGNGASLGATDHINDWLGHGDVADKCSGWYIGGDFAGAIMSPLG